MKQSRHSGLTLLELTVVTGLTLLMVAIAIPYGARAVLGVRSEAQADALTQVATAEQAFEARYGTFTGWPADLVDGIGQDLSIQAGPSDSPSTVSVAVTDDGLLGLALRTDDGVCHTLTVASAAAGGERTSGTVQAQSCTADLAIPEGAAIRAFSSSAMP